MKPDIGLTLTGHRPLTLSPRAATFGLPQGRAVQGGPSPKRLLFFFFSFFLGPQVAARGDKVRGLRPAKVKPMSGFIQGLSPASCTLCSHPNCHADYTPLGSPRRCARVPPRKQSYPGACTSEGDGRGPWTRRRAKGSWKSSPGPKTPGPWLRLMLHAAYILMLLRSLSVLEFLWVCASWRDTVANRVA